MYCLLTLTGTGLLFLLFVCFLHWFVEMNSDALLFLLTYCCLFWFMLFCSLFVIYTCFYLHFTHQSPFLRVKSHLLLLYKHECPPLGITLTLTSGYYPMLVPSHLSKWVVTGKLKVHQVLLIQTQKVTIAAHLQMCSLPRIAPLQSDEWIFSHFLPPPLHYGFA